mgnify:CR=1 FL=1
MIWTDMNVSKMMRLWGEGYSASEIAEKLGPASYVSREQIISKLLDVSTHRKKLPKNPSVNETLLSKYEIRLVEHPSENNLEKILNKMNMSLDSLEEDLRREE